MMRTLFAALFSFLMALPVFAQTAPAAGTAVTPTSTAPFTQTQIRTRTQTQTRTQTRSSTSTDPVRDEIQRVREESRGEIRQLKEGTKREIKTERENVRNAIEAKRLETRNIIEAQRAELKARLSRIKDERKKNTVEQVDAQMQALNGRKSDHFIDALDKIEKVLMRVKSRVETAAARGLDVSSVRIAIAGAETAISAGRSAVEAQAGKTYTISVATEATLKTEVKKTREALHADLKAIQEAVKSAHDAVRRAATALAQITKGLDGVTATTSTSTVQ